MNRYSDESETHSSASSVDDEQLIFDDPEKMSNDELRRKVFELHQTVALQEDRMEHQRIRQRNNKSFYDRLVQLHATDGKLYHTKMADFLHVYDDQRELQKQIYALRPLQEASHFRQKIDSCMNSDMKERLQQYETDLNREKDVAKRHGVTDETLEKQRKTKATLRRDQDRHEGLLKRMERYSKELEICTSKYFPEQATRNGNVNATDVANKNRDFEMVNNNSAEMVGHRNNTGAKNVVVINAPDNKHGHKHCVGMGRKIDCHIVNKNEDEKGKLCSNHSNQIDIEISGNQSLTNGVNYKTENGETVVEMRYKDPNRDVSKGKVGHSDNGVTKNSGCKTIHRNDARLLFMKQIEAGYTDSGQDGNVFSTDDYQEKPNQTIRSYEYDVVKHCRNIDTFPTYKEENRGSVDNKNGHNNLPGDGLVVDSGKYFSGIGDTRPPEKYNFLPQPDLSFRRIDCSLGTNPTKNTTLDLTSNKAPPETCDHEIELSVDTEPKVVLDYICSSQVPNVNERQQVLKDIKPITNVSAQAESRTSFSFPTNAVDTEALPPPSRKVDIPPLGRGFKDDTCKPLTNGTFIFPLSGALAGYSSTANQTTEVLPPIKQHRRTDVDHVQPVETALQSVANIVPHSARCLRNTTSVLPKIADHNQSISTNSLGASLACSQQTTAKCLPPATDPRRLDTKPHTQNPIDVWQNTCILPRVANAKEPTNNTLAETKITQRIGSCHHQKAKPMIQPHNSKVKLPPIAKVTKLPVDENTEVHQSNHNLPNLNNKVDSGDDAINIKDIFLSNSHPPALQTWSLPGLSNKQKENTVHSLEKENIKQIKAPVTPEKQGHAIGVTSMDACVRTSHDIAVAPIVPRPPMKKKDGGVMKFYRKMKGLVT